MRFAILRKADNETEQGCMPSEALLTAMGRYNQELVDAGVMRGGEGLRPTKEAIRIRFADGEPVITEGPFAETRELVAGFTLIEVGTKEEAIEWAKRWPKLDAEGGAELEVRQLYEFEDFVEGEGLALHRELAARMVAQPKEACPYLFFPGNCREAFEFYQQCFGAQPPILMAFSEMPEEESRNAPAMAPDSIMHACLQIGRWVLMGSDSPAEYYEKPQGFSVQIAIDDAEHAQKAFERLADGGQIRMPFEQTFWAYRFGMVVDRFGIPWMINCEIEC